MNNKILSPFIKKKGNTKLIYEFDFRRITKHYGSINIDVGECDTTMKHLHSNDSGFSTVLKRLAKHNIKTSGLELNSHTVEKCKNVGLDASKVLIQDLLMVEMSWQFIEK